MDFVLFDLGGVLCDVEPERAERAWRGVSKDASQSIIALMDESGAKPGGDVGRYDADAMADVLSAHLGWTVSKHTLQGVWGAMVSWRTFVAGLLPRLPPQMSLFRAGATSTPSRY